MSDTLDSSPAAIEAWEVLDLLTALVQKSLVVYEEDEQGRGRYRLLEAVQQYATERLMQAGEQPSTRRRHRDWFAAFADEAGAKLEGPEQAPWLERLAQEHDNLRLALDWCTERAAAEGGARWRGVLAEQGWVGGRLSEVLQARLAGDELVVGLRLAGALSPFWRVRGYCREGRERLGRLLVLAGITSPSDPPQKPCSGSLSRLMFATLAAHSLAFFGVALAGLGLLFLIAGRLRLGMLNLLILCEALILVWAFVGRVRMWRARLEAKKLIKSRFVLQNWWTHVYGLSTLVPSTWILLSGWLGFMLPLAVLLPLSLSGVRVIRVPWALVSLAPSFVVVSDILLARLLARQGRSRVAATAEAFQEAGALAHAQGDRADAWRLFRKAWVLTMSLGDCRKTVALFEQMRVLAPPRQWQWFFALWQCDYANFALLTSIQLRDEEGVAVAAHNSGTLALQEGRLQQAASLYEDCLAIWRKEGNRSGIAVSLQGLGTVAHCRKEDEAACSFYRESLKVRYELGDRPGMATCLEGLAAVAAGQARAEEAARWWGAAQALREAADALVSSADADDYERTVAASCASLGETAFDAAWAEGRAMSLEDAVQYALAEREPS
jgi:hypothetical protein